MNLLDLVTLGKYRADQGNVSRLQAEETAKQMLAGAWKETVLKEAEGSWSRRSCWGVE